MDKNKKDNLKALFTNTRTRLIIFFTFFILIIGIVIAGYKIQMTTMLPDERHGGKISNLPGNIQSIPGAINQTAQYARLQDEQNVEQASLALKTGGSSIPTIIESHAFGEGVESIPSQGSLGFVSLSTQSKAGQQSPWYDVLKAASCTKESMDKALTQGAGIGDLQQACGCSNLPNLGFSFKDLTEVCPCSELRKIGYKAPEFKEIGYDERRLRDCGFSTCELHSSGFTALQLKDAGYSDGELKGAGFTEEEISKARGLPEGMTIAEVRKAGCEAQQLRSLKSKEVTASAIRRSTGCSPAQLKSAGFNAEELRSAGFAASELKNAEYTPNELKEAGFRGRDLLNAGFAPSQLNAAGYTEQEITKSEAELPPGVSIEYVKHAGCDIESVKQQKLAGISAEVIRRYADCSGKDLQKAGFSNADLVRAGFKPTEFTQNGIAEEKSVSDEAIKAAACDSEKLRDLIKQGVNLKKVRDSNNCSLDQFKSAGAGISKLLEANFTPTELLTAGFTQKEIAEEKGVSDEAIKAAACDSEKLRDLIKQGVNLKKVRDSNNCSLDQFKSAGAGISKLLEANFTPTELLTAGFTPKDFKNSGLLPASIIASLRDANCATNVLSSAYKAEVAAKTIRDTLGCSAVQLKSAGYAALQLKEAGYSPGELQAAEFLAAELKIAGFTAKEIKDAGFSIQNLKDAGFSVKDLMSAGFDVAQLKAAGFSAKDLKINGAKIADLKAGGYTAKDLKDAGATAEELKDAGYSVVDLKKAGVSEDELLKAGFAKGDIVKENISFPGSSVAGLEGINISESGIITNSLDKKLTGKDNNAKLAATPTTTLQALARRQMVERAADQHSRDISDRAAAIRCAASSLLQSWQTVHTQVYYSGNNKEENPEGEQGAKGGNLLAETNGAMPSFGGAKEKDGKIIVRSGDILFAVLDTTVNTDEPSPILATIVSGSLKGSKLIGSFNLPQGADKMIITFNTISMPGASKTNSISAYAIDPETARTALSGRVDHHYMSRYGSMFAASFIEGFGNAFQSANTTVSIGGTGGGDNITVQNGIARSTLENALIGLSTVGKSWGQLAQQNVNRPTTIELYSGAPLGILFTQDVTLHEAG